MHDDPLRKPAIGVTALVASQFPRRLHDGRMIMSPDPPAYVVLISETVHGIDENGEPIVIMVDRLELQYLDP